jgi:hypothetical protein
VAGARDRFGALPARPILPAHPIALVHSMLPAHPIAPVRSNALAHPSPQVYRRPAAHPNSATHWSCRGNASARLGGVA